MAAVVNIAGSDRAGVVKRLSGLRSVYRRERLLPKCNEYRSDIVSAIARTPPTTRPYSKQMADYIASSTIQHVSDAWAYLARASKAALSGDPSCATHLAYYAELRACMSILAGNGIGVFKNKHFLVDASGEARAAGTGNTHEYCWDAFSTWATGSSWALFSELIRPSGSPIATWITTFPSFAAAAAVGANLFQQFGMDIANLGKDKDRRNEVSYRPSAYRGIRAQQPSVELKRRAKAAEVMVPIGEFGNCELSSAIFARILSHSFRSNHGVEPGDDPVSFRQEVNAMLVAFGAPTPLSPMFEDDLVRLALTPPLLLADAFGVRTTSEQGFHCEVLARATILTYLATLLVRQLISDSGILYGEMNFWLEPLCIDRGVYDLPAPYPIVDIWTDVESALNDADTLAARNPSQTTVQRDSWEIVGSLCQFERFLLLGLAT